VTRPTPSWCRPWPTARWRCFIVERTASGVATRGYITQDGSRAAELTLANAPATLVTPKA
jgi:hypothetical protein